MYDDVEDEELRRALAMSLQDHAGPTSKEDEKPADQ
ncbi:ubiquitin interaction motif [Haematococcus lacustris]|uniref:Ubiquitin interaction motif n=1 Tax=Haematococcus lacustris TaxID=44745 RepID=A0A699Z2J7_HAELA|nr:ubiquitin interaction motif [Haematococcus lacustris]